MNKDWVGDKNSVFSTLGASNHAEGEREENDYYATDPIAAELLLELEDFDNILEPCCGEGHLSKVFIENGIKTTSSDLIDRGYGLSKDFFEYNCWDGDIVTNPPYRYALSFINHALNIISDNRKVAMFLKLQFLEGKKRGRFFEDFPPKTVYVSRSRILCAKNGNFKNTQSSAVAYAWFIWEKGFKGVTEIKWFN